MKTTRYFEEQVLRKRPYIERDWCAAAIVDPIRRETQEDGRIRFWREVALFWREVALPGGAEPCALERAELSLNRFGIPKFGWV